VVYPRRRCRGRTASHCRRRNVAEEIPEPLSAALRHRNHSMVRVSPVVRERRSKRRWKQEDVDRLDDNLPHSSVRQPLHVLLLPFSKRAEGAFDELLGPCAELAPHMLPILRRRQAEDNRTQEEEVSVEQFAETKA